MSFLTAEHLRMVAHAMCKKYDVQILVQGDRCYVRDKVIHIPAIADGVSCEEYLTKVRYFLDHEVSHIVYETEQKWGADFGIKHGNAAFSLLNHAEDERCEHLLRKDWIGSDMNIGIGRTKIIEDLHKMDAHTRNKDDRVNGYIKSFCFQGEGLDITEDIDPRVWEYVEANYDRHLALFIGAKKTSDLNDTVLWIFNDMKVKTESPEEQEALENGEPSEKEEKGEPEGEGEPGGEPEEGEPEGKPEPGSEPGGESGEAETKPHASGSEELISGGAKGGLGAGGVMDDAETITQSDTCAPELSKAIADSVKEELTGMDEASTQVSRGVTVRDTMKTLRIADVGDNLPKAFKKYFNETVEGVPGSSRERLRQMLQSEAKTWWRSGRQCGRPDPAKLAQLVTGTSSRVFKRKFYENAPTTDVALAIDMSGSMDCQLMGIALGAAASFAKLLSLVGHKHMVYGYQSSSFDFRGGGGIEMISDWNVKRSTNEYMKPFSAAGGGTPTAGAVKFGREQLLARGADRQVLLVITDGSPDNFEVCQSEFAQCDRCGVENVLIAIGDIDECYLKDQCQRFVHAGFKLTNAVMRQLHEVLEDGRKNLVRKGKYV